MTLKNMMPLFPQRTMWPHLLYKTRTQDHIFSTDKDGEIEKYRERKMWPVLYIHLCIVWSPMTLPFFTSSTTGLDLDSVSCGLRGHFKLNRMHQDGDLILGGLFEVHFLAVFPELDFASEPEQPYCEQWVGSAKYNKEKNCK